MLTLIEATSFDAIDSFRTDWDRLAALQRWPFSEFSWLEGMASHIAAARPLAIYAIARDGSLAAAIAFSRMSRTFLELVGAAEFYEASPLLSVDQDATSSLIGHLVSIGTPFALSRLLEPEKVEPCISYSTAGRGVTIVRHPPGAPYLRLSRTSSEFRGTLSASRRNMLARKRRKLGAMGALEFDSTYPDSEQVITELTDFEEIEARGWKGREGSAIKARPGFHEFFSSVLQRNAALRRVRFDRVKLDGKTIAMQFGLVCFGRYFLIKPTYDERLGDLSPGHQLTYDAIQQSIVEGLDTYEFLGSEEPWKMLWADSVRATRSWTHYPWSTRGVVRFGADAARALVRRLS